MSDESKPTRSYSNGEITVDWRPEKCIHCESCLINLPEVFDRTRRPWVNINGSSTANIRDTVALCPDGALSIPEVAS